MSSQLLEIPVVEMGIAKAFITCQKVKMEKRELIVGYAISKTLSHHNQWAISKHESIGPH